MFARDLTSKTMRFMRNGFFPYQNVIRPVCYTLSSGNLKFSHVAQTYPEDTTFYDIVRRNVWVRVMGNTVGEEVCGVKDCTSGDRNMSAGFMRAEDEDINDATVGYFPHVVKAPIEVVKESQEVRIIDEKYKWSKLGVWSFLSGHGRFYTGVNLKSKCFVLEREEVKNECQEENVVQYKEWVSKLQFTEMFDAKILCSALNSVLGRADSDIENALLYSSSRETPRMSWRERRDQRRRGVNRQNEVENQDGAGQNSDQPVNQNEDPIAENENASDDEESDGSEDNSDDDQDKSDDEQDKSDDEQDKSDDEQEKSDDDGEQMRSSRDSNRGERRRSIGRSRSDVRSGNSSDGEKDDDQSESRNMRRPVRGRSGLRREEVVESRSDVRSGNSDDEASDGEQSEQSRQGSGRGLRSIPENPRSMFRRRRPPQ